MWHEFQTKPGVEWKRERESVIFWDWAWTGRFLCLGCFFFCFCFFHRYWGKTEKLTFNLLYGLILRKKKFLAIHTEAFQSLQGAGWDSARARRRGVRLCERTVLELKPINLNPVQQKCPNKRGMMTFQHGMHSRDQSGYSEICIPSHIYFCLFFVFFFSPLHVGVNVFVVCGTMLVVQV